MVIFGQKAREALPDPENYGINKNHAYLMLINKLDYVNSTGWYDIDMTSKVQEWVNNSTDNYGVMLKGNYEGGSGYKIWFASSDNSNSAYWPKMEVTYTFTTAATYYIRDAAGNVIASYKK